MADLPSIEKDERSERADSAGKSVTKSGQMLTVMQLSFVNALFHPAVLLDPVKAAQMANFKSPKLAAARLMKHHLVRAELEIRMARLAIDASLTPDAVLSKLWEESNNHVEEDSSPNARVGALRILAQHFDLIGPKDKGGDKPQQVNVNINLGDTPVKISGDDDTITIDIPKEGADR